MPDFLESFQDPPKGFTVVPFWFWNDALEEVEIRRQIDDFEAHGVYGFVPHARKGLPEDIGWLSDRYLHFLKVAADYAATKGMIVILYDEGMYPSGSAAGKVVAAKPRHAARALQRRAKDAAVSEDEEVIHEDATWKYVHTRSMGTIRGVHYGTDDGEPGAPPAGDILNPEAVASFLHITHDKHFEVLGEHFGKTVIAIFTDEPSKMGRDHLPDIQVWTWGLQDYLKTFLGYDFLPLLPALWEDAFPDAERLRREFKRATDALLCETYYAPYQRWCEAHGIALTGHPSGPMDIGPLKYFQLPGQDVVWRYLEPFQEKSMEGDQSTMGKCSASAQVHRGRARNMNECFGAYGWNFTWDEMRWVTNWLLVRGVNMIVPHAFYYSLLGDRRDERPPDVGPGNTWWPQYKGYADYCRRMSWLLATGTQVCEVAVLGTPNSLPWRVARVLFEHQIDFNYLDSETLLDLASVDASGVSVGGMRYGVVLLDGAENTPARALAKLQPLLDAGRVLAWKDPIPAVPAVISDAGALLAAIRERTTPDVLLAAPSPGVRFHHVRLPEGDAWFFVNEGPENVALVLRQPDTAGANWVDPWQPAAMEQAGSSARTVEVHGSVVLWKPAAALG